MQLSVLYSWILSARYLDGQEYCSGRICGILVRIVPGGIAVGWAHVKSLSFSVELGLWIFSEQRSVDCHFPFACLVARSVERVWTSSLHTNSSMTTWIRLKGSHSTASVMIANVARVRYADSELSLRRFVQTRSSASCHYRVGLLQERNVNQRFTILSIGG